MSSWVFLILAGFLEVGFTTTMKMSEGFSKWPYTLAFFILAVLSFVCLTRATSTIPMGTAYAVWTGIGAFGTALIGIFFFKEPATTMRILFLFTLIASVIGLKFVAAD
jgi:quaternary ammonium compound-resistance protein SugE